MGWHLMHMGLMIRVVACSLDALQCTESLSYSNLKIIKFRRIQGFITLMILTLNKIKIT